MIDKYDIEAVRRSMCPHYAAKQDAERELEARGFRSTTPPGIRRQSYSWCGVHELGEAQVSFVIHDIHINAYDWYDDLMYAHEVDPDLHSRELPLKVRTIFCSWTRDKHGTAKCSYEGESLDEAIKHALAFSYLPPQIKFENKKWGIHPETGNPIVGPVARYAASISGVVARRGWRIIDVYKPGSHPYFDLLLFSPANNLSYHQALQVITDGTEFYYYTRLGRIDEVQLTLYEVEREIILEAIRLFCNM